MSDTQLQALAAPEYKGAAGEQSTGRTDEIPPCAVDAEPTAGLVSGLPAPQELDGANGAKQPRMQLLLTQVRSHLRGQSSADPQKKAFLDVVQMAKVRRGTGSGTPRQESEVTAQGVDGTQDIQDGQRLKDGAGEVTDSMEALRREFKEQMDLLRTEMQAYTDRAVNGLESRMLSRRGDSQKHLLHRMSSSEQMPRDGGQGLEQRHKSLSVPSLLPGKNRVLNRTAAALKPKTRHSAALAHRSKSDTFSSSSERSGGQMLPETSDFRSATKASSAPGTLPPACAALQPNRKLLHTKGKEKP